ncbi:tyrosine recombinase XerC [mine drainage metagenome]|uniref:Tyrosine recombinase XerC n=1 Tax=mine drainage metagenome TaxID=410659 RepID=A0A1J5RDI7_9ZZZZ
MQLNRSNYFYARIQAGGKRLFFSLRVKIEGHPPASLKEEGDIIFERSRARAQAKLERISEELTSRATREELAQRVLEARTGSRLLTMAIRDLPERWQEIPRSRPLSARYVADKVATLRRFVAFTESHFPNAKDMSSIMENMALGFMRSEEARGMTAKTYNETLKLLRSSFRKLRKQAGISDNPFDDIPLKSVETVHRKPFTEDQVLAILAEAQKDPFIYRLIATGLCTAMRLGDCARLRWSQVNLADGHIDAILSKTKKRATIPIFPLLRAVLETEPKTNSEYVFSDLARQYAINPGMLTDRLRRILARIGFGDSQSSLPRSFEREIHQSRQIGLRRASLRDFHSFRVTWVTLALNRGVPVELVRKVTGHQTVGIVLEHYHQPSSDDLRQALEHRLPQALISGGVPKTTGPQLSRTVEASWLRPLLASMNDSNWAEVRKAILGVLD